VEALKRRGREALRRLRRVPSAHHGEYSAELRAALPFGAGIPLDRLVELVADSGWVSPRLERLGDVQWAMGQHLSGLDRLLGATPYFAVSASTAGRSA
jgi:hypothetical protein